jgi:hypothetical protein
MLWLFVDLGELRHATRRMDAPRAVASVRNEKKTKVVVSF